MYKILAKRILKGPERIKVPKIAKNDSTKVSPIITLAMIKTAIEIATVIP